MVMSNYNTISETMQKAADFQKEMMTNMFNMFDGTKKVDVNELVKNAFQNPFEVFNTFTKGSDDILKNSKQIMENNMRYHKAFIAYHQAVKDMMEALTDNMKIINKEK
jgi:hypothetical protein